MANIRDSIMEESLKYRLSGRNLVRLIKQKKITKYRLAKDLGVTYRAVQYWTDKNNPQKPSKENLQNLAGYFDLSISRTDEIRLIRSQILMLSERLRKLEKTK